MGDPLTYNDQNREHVTTADTLGQLQRGVVDRVITRQAPPHSYYRGHELYAAYPLTGAMYPGHYFLKKDDTGSGRGARSKNRVVVMVDRNGALIEGEAWLWRHDDRILKLGAGFFARAQLMRSI